jgi:hypothetical protein
MKALTLIVLISLAGCNAFRAAMDPNAPPAVVQRGADELRQAGDVLASLGSVLAMVGGPWGAAVGGVFAAASGGLYAAGRAVGKRRGTDELVQVIEQSGIIDGDTGKALASVMPARVRDRVRRSKERMKARGALPDFET